MFKAYTLTDLVKSHGLAICDFTGTLSRATLLPLVADIEALEAKYPEGFRRFTDLSKMYEFSLSPEAASEIAALREKSYHGPRVQSAVYAPDPRAYGTMKIYAAALFPTAIAVRVFYNLRDVARWLDVPGEILSGAQAANF